MTPHVSAAHNELNATSAHVAAFECTPKIRKTSDTRNGYAGASQAVGWLASYGEANPRPVARDAAIAPVSFVPQNLSREKEANTCAEIIRRVTKLARIGMYGHRRHENRRFRVNDLAPSLSQTAEVPLEDNLPRIGVVFLIQ